MTLPRQILPNSTYLVTRRCTQRQFLLRPSKKTNQIFLYCLALAAQKTGVLIHAFCVMSNHHHLVVTDPDGRLPEFTAHLHKLVAKCINATLGKFENLWSSEQPSQVTLLEDEEVFKKMIYVVCNSVISFLVDSCYQWPGLCSTPKVMRKGKIVAKRPDVFFSEKGSMPENITLEITRPAIYEHLNTSQFIDMFSEAIREKERELRAQAKRSKKRFMGKRKVLKQNPFDRPATTAPWRNLKPQVAGNKWRRMEALGRIKDWLQAYREAWRKWKAGARDVVFPPGTYALVHYGGACCVT
jgi:REP element-mobilizing transposase RayT